MTTGWHRSAAGSIYQAPDDWSATMANAGKHGMHPGAQGKGSGSGAMTALPEGTLGENAVLSNRDTSQHDDERGLDGKGVQTDQYQDHSANRQGADGTAGKPERP